MMGGLKSPTMNRQDRQTRNAIKRNPSPNETRPHTLGIGPKPQNARIAKSKATAVHNILKNISYLPLMLRDDSPSPQLAGYRWAADAARRRNRRLVLPSIDDDPGIGATSGRMIGFLCRIGERCAYAAALIGIEGDPVHRSTLGFLVKTVKTKAALFASTLARDRPNVGPV
jgi:hypothetical protein